MSARASERELREIDDFLRWVRAEETAAFEPVVRRFQRPLRAWLVMRSPPGVDADDVAQQSLVLAFTRLAEFQPGTDFAAWLFTIAAFQLRGEASRLRRVADYHSRYAPEMFAYSLDHRVEQAPGSRRRGSTICGSACSRLPSRSAGLSLGGMTRAKSGTEANCAWEPRPSIVTDSLARASGLHGDPSSSKPAAQARECGLPAHPVQNPIA